MKAFKSIQLITIIALSALVFTGFSGNEKYVELEGYLNGRSSRAFRSIDKNVVSVLKTGTRGEILEARKMVSGNYGLRIRVVSGSQAGKSYWVYYNTKNPDLALYESRPQTWGERTPAEKARSVEAATGTETLRDTHALTPPAVSRPKPPTPKRSTNISAADAGEAVNAIARANQSAKRMGSPLSPGANNCPNCFTPPKSVSTMPLGPVISRRYDMDGQCSALMNGAGQLGSIGKSVVNIMSEPKYKASFTSSRSLGNFCPRFASLNEAQKIQAWTWFWTALAHEESSCTVNKYHGTDINPRAGHGLWAMEKDRNIRYGRGQACSDIASAAGQARCSIDIMFKTQLSKGRSASGFSGSYWGPIRRGNSQLVPHMKRFGLCF